MSYGRWRREAGEDLDQLISDYTAHRKRKAQLLQDSSGKKQAVDPAVTEAEMAVEEADSGSSPEDDSEDEAILGGRAHSSEQEMEFSMDDLSE